MFTDIVGYTALMEEDEEKAFELLKKNRHVQRPIIEVAVFTTIRIKTSTMYFALFPAISD